MAIKREGYDGEPEAFRNEAQIGTKIMSRWILTAPLFLMTMVENMVDFIKKWVSSLKGLPQTSKKIWGLDYQMHP
jgi:hypothetical protein